MRFRSPSVSKQQGRHDLVGLEIRLLDVDPDPVFELHHNDAQIRYFFPQNDGCRFFRDRQVGKYQGSFLQKRRHGKASAVIIRRQYPVVGRGIISKKIGIAGYDDKAMSGGPVAQEGLVKIVSGGVFHHGQQQIHPLLRR